MSPPISTIQENVPKPPPSYGTTIILTAALVGYDIILSGQGFLSVFLLIFGMPVMAIRTLLAWKNRPLFWRRCTSVGIYLAAIIGIRAMIWIDLKGARLRAQELISACENFKQATGAYPEKLEILTPKHIPIIPKARRLGSMTKSDFSYFYFVSGPNSFTLSTNVHVLLYTSIPPFGKSYYVFEEKRWGFYD